MYFMEGNLLQRCEVVCEAILLNRGSKSKTANQKTEFAKIDDKIIIILVNTHYTTKQENISNLDKTRHV